jgi:hypothetical protein
MIPEKDSIKYWYVKIYWQLLVIQTGSISSENEDEKYPSEP